MTFNGQHFNSVGMYEIRGEQDGKTLKLTKPVIVNFQCTNGAAGVGFYQLNENASKWKKVKQITKEKINNRNLKKEEANEDIQNQVPIGFISYIGRDKNYQDWISTEALVGKKRK